MASIIVLNGNSSVGKSSIARALQKITVEPFLHVPMDAFLDMMSPRLFEEPDGMIFEALTENGRPIVAIRVGAAAERVLRGMRLAMAAMADAGNNLILDDVMIDNDHAKYVEALSGHHVHWVGVFAPLEILEKRERERADREIGLARWLFDRLHKGINYDLEIDTVRMSAEEGAQQIKEQFGL